MAEVIIDENTCMAQDNANKVGDKELLPFPIYKFLNKHYLKWNPLKNHYFENYGF